MELYCNYQGMYRDIDNADEEFAMLLELSKHPNFKEMFGILLCIIGCAEENPACIEALKNSECNISEYIKKLLDFYEKNAGNIKEPMVIEMLERLKIILNRGVKTYCEEITKTMG